MENSFKKFFINFFSTEKGFAVFLTTLCLLGIISIIIASLSLSVLTEQKIIKNFSQSAQAYFSAESGIEDSLYRILAGKNYQVTNSLNVSESVANINIYDQGSNQKIIKVEGNQNNRSRILQLKLEVNTNSVSFHYGAQVGEGGLFMYNNSTIVGNVYSNGNINGANGASITGDAWVASLPAEVDQQSTETSSSFIFGQSGDKIDVAQSFIPSKKDYLTKINLYLKKSGSPSNKTLRILTDNNNKPSKTLVASGAYGTLNTSQLSQTNFTWITITLNTPPLLQAGQRYWITVDSSADNNNYLIWGLDPNDTYPNGTGKYSPNWNASNPQWIAINGDLAFKIFLGSVPHYLNNVSVEGNAHANTILNSRINGDAYYQKIENSTVNGTLYPDSPDPPYEALPISEQNINDWKEAAAAGGTINGDYVLAMWQKASLGPKKINGNLILLLGADLTLTGNVYVTGDIIIYGNCHVRLAENFGETSGVLLNDGIISTGVNVKFHTNSSNSYILLLSTGEGDVLTINNNSTAALFYAAHGNIIIANNVSLKEVTGYSITLANNAQIVYESGLASVRFSSGQGASWKISDWQETF